MHEFEYKQMLCLTNELDDICNLWAKKGWRVITFIMVCANTYQILFERLRELTPAEKEEQFKRWKETRAKYHEDIKTCLGDPSK
jgi:hypothetical protein